MDEKELPEKLKLSPRRYALGEIVLKLANTRELEGVWNIKTVLDELEEFMDKGARNE